MDEDALKKDVMEFVAAGPGRWLASCPDLAALRASPLVQRFIDRGFAEDEAVLEALKAAIGEIRAEDYGKMGFAQFGFAEQARDLSQTARENLASTIGDYEESWFRAKKAYLKNRAPREFVVDEVVALLLEQDRAVGPALLTIPYDPNDASRPGSWWADQLPDPETFNKWEPQSTEAFVQADANTSWRHLWVHTYVTFDRNDPRRQRFFWTGRIQATVDDLVVYPKAFLWTGGGRLEDVTVLTPGATWLGEYVGGLRGDSSKFRHHVFHLGRAVAAGEQLTLSYSDTWYDQQFFFNPFHTIRARHAGYEYIASAVRFPPSLGVYGMTEMEWQSTGESPPRVVRSHSPQADVWYGIKVFSPKEDTGYGFRWRSHLYDGDQASEAVSSETGLDPGQPVGA